MMSWLWNEVCRSRKDLCCFIRGISGAGCGGRRSDNKDTRLNAEKFKYFWFSGEFQTTVTLHMWCEGRQTPQASYCLTERMGECV